MELEELQSAWTQMSTQLEQQKKLTNEIIMKMTQENYRNKFRTLTTFESFGAIICYTIAFFILWNFNKLDTWYFITFGLLALTFLMVLPTLVLRSLFKIQKLDIVHGDYKTNLLRYTTAKNNLLGLQRLGIGIGFLMMFIIAPLSSKIFSDKDIFLTEFKITNWVGLLLALGFMVLFSRWGYRSYKKVTNSAAAILKDLE